MAEYPYINTTGKLQEFFAKMSEIQVPPAANTKWLPKIGFGSNNHRPILKILRFLGFLDGTKPTERWKAFRDNTQAGRVMAEAILEGYAALYGVYDVAHKRSEEELQNFFRGEMSGGKQVIANAVKTFGVLCSFADFDEVAMGQLTSGATNGSTEQTRLKESRGDENAPAVPLHINIQVHIAADATSDQVDAIFSSMAKHLYAAQQAE